MICPTREAAPRTVHVFTCLLSCLCVSTVSLVFFLLRLSRYIVRHRVGCAARIRRVHICMPVCLFVCVCVACFVGRRSHINSSASFRPCSRDTRRQELWIGRERRKTEKHESKQMRDQNQSAAKRNPRNATQKINKRPHAHLLRSSRDRVPNAELPRRARTRLPSARSQLRRKSAHLFL